MLLCVIHGPVAQLVARFVRNEEVTGSIPVRSTVVSGISPVPYTPWGIWYGFVMRTFWGFVVTLFLLLGASPAFAHMGEGHEVEGPAPTVEITAEVDHVGGFNIHIVTENFRWAPENASQEFVPGEGHAHLYVDGEKVARVYGEWFHLNTSSLGLEPGEHELTVDLNGNDHGVYLAQGIRVAASSTIEIGEDSQDSVLDVPLVAGLLGGGVGIALGAGGALFLARARKNADTFG